MVQCGSIGTGAVAACIGVMAGLLVGRKQALSGINGAGQLRQATNGNSKWMSPQQRALALGLMASGHRHLFRSWPAPGVHDGEKHALMSMAQHALLSGTSNTPTELEAARLAVLMPPLAAEKPKVLELHGDSRVDEFYWLRDDDRKNPEILAHLKAENDYTKAVLADTETLQEELYKEMRGRIKEEDCSVPERLHGFYYYSRTMEGAQYKIHCRRKVPSGAPPPNEKEVLSEQEAEEVVLDENLQKEKGKFTFYMVGTAEPSPNHQLYAYSEDTVGGEKYTLHVKDLTTGAEVMDPIPDTCGGVVWAADNKTLFYVVKDHLDRPYKVLRHVVGRPSSEDVVVFEEKDESFYVGVYDTRSEKVILISSGSAVTSESRYILSDCPNDEFKVLLPRQQDVEYDVSHRGDYFYVTIRDKARPNSEVMVVSVSDPTKSHVIQKHNPEVKIESVRLSARYMAVFERRGGLQRAVFYSLPADGSAPSGELDRALATEITFEEPAYSLGGGGTGDFDSPLLRLSYSSLTTPSSVIDYNMETKARCTKKVQAVLGGFNKEDYVTDRLWATAADGVKVPLSLVYRKGVAKMDGTDPLLLNGYGSYEICNDVYFSGNRLCLLDRGWVFAMAHIRGGGEMGRSWYEDGKFLKKRNTFTDFISCAEHLVKTKVTTPKRLCIEGRSAGGLLMGAVTNMRPDLFNAVIMGVPFVDVVTTMVDETIPLTIIEWEEWGNPKEKEFYDYMKSYSPMDNVKPALYPHILATGGLHDPRVAYWEPAKHVAKLRKAALSTDPSGALARRLLLLKMEMGAGHFSVTGRFEKLKEVAFEYAFLLKVQGMLGAKAVPGSPASTYASKV